MGLPCRELTFMSRIGLRWAREIPYEKLNSLAVRSPLLPFCFLSQTLPNIFGVGRDVCTREQLLPDSGPRPEVSRRLFGELSGLNAAPGNEVRPFYVFEYFPSTHGVHFTGGWNRLAPFSSHFDGGRYEMSPELAQRRRVCEACCTPAHEYRRRGRNPGIGWEQHAIWKFQSVLLFR